ncbi:3'-5' exonuclease [Thermodesulfobacteriota bacterium]
MATMIPNDIEEFTTDGEKRFYQFLKAVAKPDSEFISWYTPDIEGNEPDFLLFYGKVGLIVFEVKDWVVEQITKANPQTFTLEIGSKTEDRENPFHQAHRYLFNVMNKIEKDERLVSRDPNHKGKSKVPIAYGVIFPNINKHEYIKHGLDKIIDPAKVFFWDDLSPYSDICADITGNCFRELLLQKFDPLFPCQISGADLHHLRQLLFPEIRIMIPERDHNADRHREGIKLLDHQQETLARKYDGGHRIIIGPSGSGKTLILAHKAAFLLRYNPKIKYILFLCYNITLVNYIKRLLSEKRIPLGENGVEVLHFFELCSKILNEKINFEKETGDYYQSIIEMVTEELKNSNHIYDAILVDEGQDFSDEMLRVITGLLNKKTNSLTIVLDENQNIYKKAQTWKELGIKAQGRVHAITNTYRNTKEIVDFANEFIGNVGKSSLERAKQLNMFPEFCVFHGPKPSMKQFSDINSQLDYIAKQINKLRDKDDLPLSEIAVIYSKGTHPQLANTLLPERIGFVLDSAGILCEWVSEDYRAKKNYDITTERVAISTIHSVKGLDYSCVFLVGLDLLDDSKWSEEQIHKMTYVAITRARYQLFIPYIDKTLLIDKLLTSL